MLSCLRDRLIVAVFGTSLLSALLPLKATADESSAAVEEISGKWTYRSFHNRAAPVGGDPDAAIGLYFAEATFTFDVAADLKLTGAIDWEGGGLDLAGTVQPATGDTPITLHIVGSGRPGSGTEGWRYDYHGSLAHSWPEAVNQIPAIVGSVLRAEPHGGAPKGYTASFIAVRQ